MTGSDTTDHRVPGARPGRSGAARQRPVATTHVPPRRSREVGAWLFHPTDPGKFNDGWRPENRQLAAEVARQLLPLVEERVVQPGQVIYDIQGIVFRIIGVDPDDDVLRKKAQNCCQPAMVFQFVAQRYGLVRHRPVRVSDPPPPAHPGGRTRSWEISPAAQVLTSVVAEELVGEHLRL